jgi:mRNA interferase RelE/StbE
MDKYTIKWRKSAVKEIRNLPNDIAKRILLEIEMLAENPFCNQSKKLNLLQNHYRLRVSNYRVIYSIYSNELIIEIIKIGHRKEVYR